MPKISVVIPIYNKAPYLKNTIKSVLNQSFKDFELILVNDGSTDQSKAIIQSFTDKRIIYLEQENQGVAIARNKGATIAKSALIAFLDADDLWYSHHLSTLWQLQQNYPNAAFFATAYEIKYKHYLKTFALNIAEKDVLIDKFYRFDYGQGLFFVSNFAIRKNIFLQEGGLKPKIHAEDTEFFLRLGLKYPMAYSKNVTMQHLNAAQNSLFAKYKLDEKIRLLNFFKEDDQQDKDLKRYLDIHRFTWAMEYKIVKNKVKAQELIAEITTGNLNWKQKLLLKTPGYVLRFLKNLQQITKNYGLGLFIYHVPKQQKTSPAPSAKSKQKPHN